MKIIGYIAIAIGVIFAISALFMDVTVATSGGYRVNNLGLMSSRQNYMIFGGFVAIAGIIVALVGDKLKGSKCPYCAELINSEAVKCKHCGSDVTPSKTIVNTNDAGASDRLADVNVKLIAGIVLAVFAAIIGAIMFYRQ
ncbi:MULTISPECIES: zinc ribbon domain-containing protein [Klebsiella]|uniref:zinc ribbon domain-containing protein n=1 Tax=Klebsiella TaxID=570 RepID=UPI001D0F5BF2|nr:MULTISPECIES: zinc ribbon domain-containing protein [Klebsiella]MCL6718667.1 zinc ribbon domain-containing protein [Klebsiella sp. T2.Ur]MDN3821488.1 zinc ribbon domain-containing protein [Klebsiella aerogenes]MDU6964985.1 zinc ribbon domain-containing protein [Klebsiella aerogenes]MDU9363511.1 zinc ribbon domain-containing protein [Klebsiella sp. 141203]WPS52190.1 zinc ribbon domain-containing protein [Klebsiella aerogenes]